MCRVNLCFKWGHGINKTGGNGSSGSSGSGGGGQHALKSLRMIFLF